MAKRKSRTRPRKRPRGKPRRAGLQRRAVEAALAGIVHDIRTPLTGVVALAGSKAVGAVIESAHAED